MGIRKLHIKVTTKAKVQRIKEELLDDGSTLYRIYVTAAPENNKANQAVVNLLAKTFGVAKSSITLVQGHHSREKIIEIQEG